MEYIHKIREIFMVFYDFLFLVLENENNELETLVRLLNDSEHVESANIVGAEQHDAEQDVKEEYIKIEVSD